MSYTTVKELFEGIGDAIRAKDGTAALISHQDMPARIRAIPQSGIVPTGTLEISQNGQYDVTNYAGADVQVGGGGLEEGEVNFYDFDGTLLYVMTIAEANAMTALPAIPDHSQDEVPLSNGEWNYTLAELQTLQIPLNVGACYTITDGKHHAIFEVDEEKKLVVICCQASDTVDWGDGTTTTGVSPQSHTYAQAGRYHVKWSTLTNSTNSIAVRKTGGSTSNTYPGAYDALRELYLANSTNYNTIRSHAGLEKVLLDKSISGSLSTNIFQECVIPHVNFPRGITSLSYAFYNGVIGTVSVPSTLTYHTVFGKRYSCITNAPETTLGSAGGIPTEEIYIQNSAMCTFSTSLNTKYTRRIIVTGPCKFTGAVFAKNALLESARFDQLAQMYEPSSTSSNGTFSYCANLKALIIGASSTIKKIGRNCFNYTGIKELDLPATVTSIESSALNATSSLTKLVCRNPSPPTFSYTGALPAICAIYVPDESVETYKASTNWASFADIIHGISEM